MDHDRLFKELLSNFFIEFLDLFFPKISSYLDPSFELIRMDKELFTDVTLGESTEVDLVMKAKVRGSETFFLVHVESQSQSQANFPKRMFRYFGRLSEIHDLPVYPIVIYSHGRPARAEPTSYRIEFPDLEVLNFKYAVIQLNRMPWRDYLNSRNPVASALMARMKMTEAERPRVKLECLRLLASLKLNPARSKLIGGFIDSYLTLSTKEAAVYRRELESLDPAEKETTMALVSSWEQRGIEKGIQLGRAEGVISGKVELIIRQFRHNGIDPSPAAITRLENLNAEQLDDLFEDAYHFKAPHDIDQWLSNRRV